MAGQRRLQFYQADVFTDQPFGGNPVAVFPDADGLTDEELQQIAREMNLSETVFAFSSDRQGGRRQDAHFYSHAGNPVRRPSRDRNIFRAGARWTASRSSKPVTRVLQECNLGLFPVDIQHAQRRDRACRDGATEPAVSGCDRRTGSAVRNRPRVGHYKSCDNGYSLSRAGRLHGAAGYHRAGADSHGGTVRSFPTWRLLRNCPQQYGANGIMVFSTMTVEQSSSVHTRMFAPLIGIVEDPATGSASGALGAYLVQHGVVDIRPETEITAEQGYEIDRPSRILIQVSSDDDVIQGVTVGGQAMMVVEGTLTF